MNNTNAISPLWISHRGLKQNAVENTLEAFGDAVADGFTALETDLRLSKDHHIVLCHDATLNRLAGDPRPIARLTRLELEKIRLPDGGSLCFLDQFMSEFRCANWSFDIKPEQGQETIRILGELLEHAYPEKISESPIRFCTWRKDHEQALMTRFPQAIYYARRAECWQAGLAVFLHASVCGHIQAGRTYAVPARLGGISLFKKEITRQYHRRGARTIAFLPRNVSDEAAAQHACFDEILTDGRILKA